jgi:hypothetical protein
MSKVPNKAKISKESRMHATGSTLIGKHQTFAASASNRFVSLIIRVELVIIFQLSE